MRKKWLSLTLALTLCLGLTVPAFAKDLKDAAKQDILNTFTIYRNGSVDEKEGHYLDDTPFKLLGLEEDAVEKENCHVISKNDTWTITNTGSRELSASGNTDYELLIQLILYYPKDGAKDEYVYRGSYYWSDEKNFFSNDSKAVRLKAGESVTIPASALMNAKDIETDSNPIYELHIDISYQGVYDDWQYYKRYYSDILHLMRSGSFYFRIDEARKEQLDATVAESETPGAPSFTDVPSWCAAEADWAAGEGIAKGIGNNLFAPDNTCTHIQILTFLWRAGGKQPAASHFTLSDPDYQGAANWAYEQGMIGDSFDPGAYCTRADAVSYIWQAFDSESPGAGNSGFTDVSPDASYAAAVSWAVEKGVTNGFGDTFRPGETCTRGQIVTFLYRAYVQPLSE